MKTQLLLNPTPGFGEIRSVDAWMTERHLTPGDVEFRFLDLDGDDDPTVHAIGVREASVPTTELASTPSDAPDFPWVVRNAWRAMRDDADGEMPDRAARLDFLMLVLRAVQRDDGTEDPATVPGFARIVEDIGRRMRRAEHTAPGRPQTHRTVEWRGKKLHATCLSVASGFESGAAFRVMNGIDVLIAHDARGDLKRTAFMAKRTLDLTPLFEAIFVRLSAIEPECWSLVPVSKPGPTPIIVPARRLSHASRIADDTDALFHLLQECAAGPDAT